MCVSNLKYKMCIETSMQHISTHKLTTLRFRKKTGHLTIHHNFGKCEPSYKKFQHKNPGNVLCTVMDFHLTGCPSHLVIPRCGTPPVGYCPSTASFSVRPYCKNARRDRCQEYHNCFPFGEETTRTSSNYVDEDYPARPEIKQSLTG